MNKSNQLKLFAKNLRRTLKLSPMQKIFRAIQQQGIRLETVDALEVFGGDGHNHTKDLASAVASLEIWEIKPEHEAVLQKNFPEATIKITDSYAEINRTSKKYGLVVVDNTTIAYNRYEHFDLFPALFQVLVDPALVILNVIPSTASNNSEHLKRRQEFYKVVNPAEISLHEVEKIYRSMAAENNWHVEWFLFQRRWTFSSKRDVVYYAVMKLGKP